MPIGSCESGKGERIATCSAPCPSSLVPIKIINQGKAKFEKFGIDILGDYGGHEKLLLIDQRRIFGPSTFYQLGSRVAIQLTKSVPEFMPQLMPRFLPEFVPQIHLQAHPDSIGQKIHAPVCARDLPYPFMSEVG